jgi:isopenicillin N synthase-like dioxygenase
MQLLRGTADDRRQFVEALGGSLRTVGFAVLTGHGVDAQLTMRAPHEVEAFFTRHSLATKRRFNAQVQRAHTYVSNPPHCTKVYRKRGAVQFCTVQRSPADT